MTERDDDATEGLSASADPELLDAFLEESAEGLQDLERSILLLESGSADAPALHAAFRAAHTLKGNAASLGLGAITGIAHAVEDVLGRIREGALPPERAVVDALLAGSDALRVALSSAGSPGTAAKAHLAVSALRALTGSATDTKADTATIAGAAGPSPDEAVREDAAAGSIRVPTERVDRLANLAGEIVVTQSVVAQLVATYTPEKLGLLQEAVSELERHSRELQERVMSIRMLPLGRLFAHLPRLARDLVARTGKDVRLVISGQDTEVDKSVIEKIRDPLVHLVRNAVDHGIEPAADRVRAGKPPGGTVRVSAGQAGGAIFIEVSDDGSGLDRERILRRAVSLGLVVESAALDDETVFGLVFAPGFSTAVEVTDVSGRGVGMDVVKQNVEAIGGTIGITSRPGLGATFRIELPLTLAILDGQLVRVGDATFVVPVVHVVESRRPAPNDVRALFGKGEILNLREEVVPVLRLHRVLGLDTETRDPAHGILVIVETERGRVALGIDGLLGQHQVVVKSLEPNFRRVPGIAGATILGDGRVALILDVPGLVAMAKAPPATPPSNDTDVLAGGRSPGVPGGLPC